MVPGRKWSTKASASEVLGPPFHTENRLRGKHLAFPGDVSPGWFLHLASHTSLGAALGLISRRLSDDLSVQRIIPPMRPDR